MILTDVGRNVTLTTQQLERVLLNCEPVKGDRLEFGGSGFAGRRSWALASRPWAKQYCIETAVRECSERRP
jgi:hypothetical protein